MTSVNTNSSATTALRTLQQTNKALDTTQNKISTGLKIGEAKDNAAYWAISTTLKSDNKSLSTVKDALGLGAATVDVAYQGLNKSKEVLEEIQKKLTAATQDGVDRTIIQSEINELKKQLVAIAGASSFSGENWLSVDSSAAGYNGTKQLVSSFSRSASNVVSIGTIGVETAAIKLFDASTTADGVLDSKVALKKADGTSLSYGGFAAVAGPSTTALNFAGTATGSAGTSVASAVATLGTLNLAGVTDGDKITFALNVDGASNTVRLDTTGLTAANFASSLQSAIDGTVGAGKATVKVGGTVNGTSGAVTLTAATSGSASQITVGPVTVVDGNGVVTDTAGILTSVALPAPNFGASFKASAALGTTYALPAAGGAIANQVLATVTGDFGGAGTVTFNATFNGVTKAVTTASFANNATAATQATSMAGAMQTAIDLAFAGEKSVQNGRVYAAGDIVVDTTGAQINIKTAKVGSKESVVIGPLTGSVGAAFATGMSSVAGVTATGTGTGAGVVVGDTISMNVQYGSTVKQVSHTFAAADFVTTGIAAAWATKGQPTNNEWNAFLQTKIDTAFAGSTFNGAAGGAAYVAGDVKVVNAANTFSVETRKTGADMSVGISAMAGTVYGAASTLGLAATSTSNYYNASNALTVGTGAVGYGKATSPLLDIGTFADNNIKPNDRISMTINVGGSEKTIVVATDGMLPYAGGANTAANANTFQTKVQNALDAAFGGGVATFTAIDAGNANKMTLKTAATGSTAYLAISNVVTADGNGANSGTAGLTAGITNTGLTANGTNVASASTAVLASGTAFTGPMTINANDTIGFSVSIDGVAKTVNIDRARVDAALTAGANGVIANGADYAAVLNSAFTAAGVAATVTAPANVLTFTRNGGAGAGTVEVTGVTSSGGSSTMSVDGIDLTATAFTSLSAAQKKEVLTSYISVVNTAIKSVTTAASNLGSVASRIELQQSFVDTLMDTIDKGVGNLVDADLSEESTRLQALQTKQQLGVQALSIANQSSQNILRLFQ